MCGPLKRLIANNNNNFPWNKATSSTADNSNMRSLWKKDYSVEEHEKCKAPPNS